MPQLRIVDDALWQRVKSRQNMLRFAIGRDPVGNALNRAHRRHFLLSGLLICGSCGGGYTSSALIATAARRTGQRAPARMRC